MKTGNTPKSVLRENPDLRRAVELINRMETGIKYSLKDLSYKELKLVEFVKNIIEDVKNQEMREKQQEMKSNW